MSFILFEINLYELLSYQSNMEDESVFKIEICWISFEMYFVLFEMKFDMKY